MTALRSADADIVSRGGRVFRPLSTVAVDGVCIPPTHPALLIVLSILMLGRFFDFITFNLSPRF